MAIRIGINGFGRMGRLALRAAWEQKTSGPGNADWEVVHVNEPNGAADLAAHLLTFDSTHGRWPVPVVADGNHIRIGDSLVSYSQGKATSDVDWRAHGVDLLLECSGKYKTKAQLDPYFGMGIRKVVVSAPVKKDALNIVMGVNDHLYDAARHDIVTAASCTTNCLAPVVKIVHQAIGIKHGMITTIHNVTNTQSLLDKPTKDFRRARSALLNLIPTTTGSATAIGLIFPELQGRLDGVAIRVPLLNSSITDCVFEVNRPTEIGEVNELLKRAAEDELAGILAYEARPLVSTDYRGDTHSSIIDALSTMVTNKTQVKILAWYDNEMGYAHRLAELALMVAGSM